MTSETSVDIREVIFINRRCYDDYIGLPTAVLESADQAIDALQNGRPLPAKMFRSLKRNLAGIDEIRQPYDDDTYRIYVHLGCPFVVMVLDAGIKKSPEGGEIPKWQVERLKERLANAKRYCADNKDDLRSAHECRIARRTALESAKRDEEKEERVK